MKVFLVLCYGADNSCKVLEAFNDRDNAQRKVNRLESKNSFPNCTLHVISIKLQDLRHFNIKNEKLVRVK